MRRLTSHVALLAVLGLALCVFTQTANATTVIIDDFSAPVQPATYVISLNNTDPLVLKQPSGIGGERDLLVDVLGSPTTVSAVGAIGGGSYQFGTAGSVATKATLQYDGIDADTAGALVNALGLNANLSDGGNNNGLRLEFDSVDGGTSNGLRVDIAMTSANGSATFGGVVPDNPNFQNYDVLFSAFTSTPGFNPAAVTSIQFTFNNNGSNNADFNITQISAQGNLVPEPGSVALAAIGGAFGLLAIRRRRARAA